MPRCSKMVCILWNRSPVTGLRAVVLCKAGSSGQRLHWAVFVVMALLLWLLRCSHRLPVTKKLQAFGLVRGRVCDGLARLAFKSWMLFWPASTKGRFDEETLFAL